MRSRQRAAQFSSEFLQKVTNAPPFPRASRRLPECEARAAEGEAFRTCLRRADRRAEAMASSSPIRRRAPRPSPRAPPPPRAPPLTTRASGRRESGERRAVCASLRAGGRRAARVGGIAAELREPARGGGAPWRPHPAPASRRGEGPPLHG